MDLRELEKLREIDVYKVGSTDFEGALHVLAKSSFVHAYSMKYILPVLFAATTAAIVSSGKGVC